MIKFNTLFTNIDSFTHFYLKRFPNNQNSVSHFLLTGSFTANNNDQPFSGHIQSFIFQSKTSKTYTTKLIFNHKGIKYAEN